MTYTKSLAADWFLAEQKRRATEFFTSLRNVLIAAPVAAMGIILSHLFFVMNSPIAQVGHQVLQYSF